MNNIDLYPIAQLVALITEVIGLVKVIIDSTKNKKEVVSKGKPILLESHKRQKLSDRILTKGYF